MAIMVTDPRNNLLSQLTAVGQQYLAGKQQERMSATEFANKKALIELMDRLGGAADTREFAQEKELLDLQTKAQQGLLTAAGEQRLNELEQQYARDVQVAQIGATGAVDAARASKPDAPAPFDPVSMLERILPMIRGQEDGAAQPNPLIAQPFSIPPDLQSDVANYVGSNFLEKIQEAGNDANSLRAVGTELATSPLRLFRGPKTQAKLLKLINDRVEELDRVGTAVQGRELATGDIMGAAQLIRDLFPPR